MDINLQLKEITFEQIREVWLQDLWPNRTDVKPMSSMVYGEHDNHDMSIYEKYIPTFWGIFNDDQIIAVNSGFRTNDQLYRTRGIWVRNDHRGNFLSSMLFDAIDAQAKLENCTHIWSFPRFGSHLAYLRAGYTKTSDWYTNNSYGKNCYVLKNIVPIE
jgi:hypothetical protein